MRFLNFNFTSPFYWYIFSTISLRNNLSELLDILHCLLLPFNASSNSWSLIRFLIFLYPRTPSTVRRITIKTVTVNASSWGGLVMMQISEFDKRKNSINVKSDHSGPSLLTFLSIPIASNWLSFSSQFLFDYFGVEVWDEVRLGTKVLGDASLENGLWSFSFFEPFQHSKMISDESL